jgi:demethylmenaquinone methyltransferase/2-methoxy-6-polyprenyl-1,4-benzoquinol methylase
MLAETMDKEYYEYISKFASGLAKVYAIADFLAKSTRNKVVAMASPKRGSRILDVATGTGELVFAFAKKGLCATGIDLSKDMLRIARKNNKYEKANFEIADAASTPFKRNLFDVSCISLTLHDMPFRIREKVLREMVRITKLQGTIIIVDYAPLPKNRILRFLAYQITKLYETEYYSEFARSDQKGQLQRIGIEIREEIPSLVGTLRILKCTNTSAVSTDV